MFESPRGLVRPSVLLVEALPKRPVRRILTGMDTEGAVAMAAAVLHPEAEVSWFHLDLYVAAKVRAVLAHNLRTDVRADAGEDPPDGPFDLAAIPFPVAGEALLARDLAEAVHDRLAVGGRLVAATDGSGGGLRSVLEKVFGKVTAGPVSGTATRRRKGVVFYADRRRERPVHAPRSHVLRPSIVGPDGGDPVTFELETRPGTFSHGSLDRGTKALLGWFRPGAERSFLDLGAGCGAIGLHVARAVPESRVVMVESNLRAVGCARRNAERNGVADRVQVVACADLEAIPACANGVGYDMCLANPPYFSDLRIATAFARAAHAALRPGGTIAMVARAGGAADAHVDVLREVFDLCTPWDAGDYTILTSRK